MHIEIPIIFYARYVIISSTTCNMYFKIWNYTLCASKKSASHFSFRNFTEVYSNFDGNEMLKNVVP